MRALPLLLLLVQPAMAQLRAGTPASDVSYLRPQRSILATVSSSGALFATPSASTSHVVMAIPGVARHARSRGSHAVIGGIIGGAAGIVACTAISNATKDSSSGFTTCTAKGYALFGVGGVLIGALIGSLIK